MAVCSRGLSIRRSKMESDEFRLIAVKLWWCSNAVASGSADIAGSTGSAGSGGSCLSAQTCFGHLPLG